MKYLCALFIVLMISSSAIAQEETLFGSDVTFGGYGALVVKITEINDQSSVLVGARGGLIINHSFVLGIGGYGLATTPEREVLTGLTENAPVDFGYGGLFLEVIPISSKLVHPSFSILIGAGEIQHNFPFYYYDDYDYFDNHSDTFFAFEPEAGVELNLLSYMRIGAGISYRYIGGIDLPGEKDSNYRGFSGSFLLKFGKF